MTAQERINLILQVADGQRIERGFAGLQERSFQLFDFGSLRRSKIVPPQRLGSILDAIQRFTKQTGRPRGGRCGIVQLMGQPGGELAQSQPDGRAAAPAA